MKLSTQVGLGPGHIALDGDPALPLQRGTSPIFDPYLLRPNGCMDQDGTWHGGRPQPRRLCVRWGPTAPLQKGGGAPSPIFSPFILWPKGWIHQDATWYGGRPQPMALCVRWGPSPSPKRRWSPLPNFGPFLLWPNGWVHQDATWCGDRPQPKGLCVRLGLSLLPKRGWSPAIFGPSIAAKRLYGSRWHRACRWVLVQATLR